MFRYKCCLLSFCSSICSWVSQLQSIHPTDILFVSSLKNLCVCVCVRACVLCVCVCFQSHPTLCDPMDCSSPGSSVHRIFQERILQWVAVFCARGSSQHRDRTNVFCIGRWVLYHCATWEAKTSAFLSKGDVVIIGIYAYFSFLKLHQIEPVVKYI